MRYASLAGIIALASASSSHAGGAVAGRVTLADGTPPPACELSLAALGIRVTTDSAGNFVLEDVPTGEHVAVCLVPGASPREVTFNSSDLALEVLAVELDIDLRPIPWTLLKETPGWTTSESERDHAARLGLVAPVWVWSDGSEEADGGSRSVFLRDTEGGSIQLRVDFRMRSTTAGLVFADGGLLTGDARGESVLYLVTACLWRAREAVTVEGFWQRQARPTDGEEALSLLGLRCVFDIYNRINTQVAGG